MCSLSASKKPFRTFNINKEGNRNVKIWVGGGLEDIIVLKGGGGVILEKVSSSRSLSAGRKDNLVSLIR